MIITDKEINQCAFDTKSSAAKFVVNNRRELDLSIYRLSKLSGISEKTIKKIERGETVKIDVLSKVIKVLGGRIMFL